MVVDPGFVSRMFEPKLREPLMRRTVAGLILALLVVTSPATGQLPSLLTKPSPPAPTSNEQGLDPLGRNTPRGTIRGFMKAVDRNDFAAAVQYLQISGRQRIPSETLARDLKELMNRYFSQPVALISDSPEGTAPDGLPLDRERVGSLRINDQRVDVTLVRVADLQNGRIWLISAETLAGVPALFDAIEENWIDRSMPEWLLNHELFYVSLAQWIVWLASIALSLILFWLASRIAVRILAWRMKDDPRRIVIESWYHVAQGPLVLSFASIVNLVVVYSLGLSLTARMIFSRVALVLLIIALTWMFRRIISLLFTRARRSMEGGGDSGMQSGILLAERLLRVAITLVAIFSIFTVIGVDTTTALAGVGIGGVAIAFGAQKTVENLLGGIFLLTDKALAVGDMCRIGDRIGKIEDITLRSVRLRTAEQTLLLIPAGALSQANIENFATRSKILLQSILYLRYGMSMEQLKSVLDKVRRLLAEDPRFEAETARIQLTSFGPASIQLELFAYARTRNDREFMAAREDLLLRIGDAIEASGGGFALPPQVLYIRRDSETEADQKAIADAQGLGADGHDQPRASRRTGDRSRTQAPSTESDAKRAS